MINQADLVARLVRHPQQLLGDSGQSSELWQWSYMLMFDFIRVGRYAYFQVGQKLGGGASSSVPHGARQTGGARGSFVAQTGSVRRTNKWDDDEFQDAMGYVRTCVKAIFICSELFSQ